MNTRRAVILGSTGFIGRALAERFRREDRLAVEGYGSRDLDLARPGSDGRLAGILDPECLLVIATRSRKPTDTLEHFHESAAVDSTIARAASRSPPGRCVYLSSIAVHGEASTNLAIREESPLGPCSYYGLAKVAGEFFLSRAARDARFPLAIVRPSAVYGPGGPAASYGPGRFIQSVLDESVARLYGDGADRRDHLYIDDLVEVVARLAKGEAEGVFVLGTGRSEPFRAVLEILRKEADRPFDVLHEERTRPRVDIGVDASRLRTALGGLRLTELETGLGETYRMCVALRHAQGA